MRQLPLIAFLVTFLSVLWRCAADLVNRAEVCTYSCPLANADHYPLGLGSGPSNNTLRCNYPPVWNCQYDTSTGLLLRDRDDGYCLTSASCRTSPCSSSDCPPFDRFDFPLGLGLGSQAYGSVLFCVYPGARQLSNVTSYCNYDMSTGDLTADHATSTCAPRAISQGCATAATSTAFMTSTVTSTPSATLSKARKSMIAVGTSLGVVAIVMVFITMYFIIKRRSELKGGGGSGSSGNSSNGGNTIATPPAALLRNNGGFQDSATYPTTRDRSVYSGFSASSGLNPMQPNLPQV